MANYSYKVNFPMSSGHPHDNRPTAYPQAMPNAYQVDPSTLPIDDSIISIGLRPQVNLPFRASIDGHAHPGRAQWQQQHPSLAPRPPRPVPHMAANSGIHLPYHRPRPSQPCLYNPNSSAVLPRQHYQPHLQALQAALAQAKYLDMLAAQEIPKVEISTGELAEKNALRTRLEQVCQKALPDCELRCFGSLITTFATKSSDMDLVLLSSELKPDLHLIEKVLLESGYCARLLKKTRVPIIKIGKEEDRIANSVTKQGYEVPKPTPNEVNEGSNSAIEEENEAHKPTTNQEYESSELTTKRDDELPQPVPRQGLETQTVQTEGADGHVQCDINFANRLGLQNSYLLKCYSLCDPRVRRMVLFVKAWTKKRQINSSYHGTLSSYGYVLMVLHFLINIVDPPVLPNLQLMPQAFSDDLSAKDVKLDNYDIRFFRNESAIKELRDRKEITANNDSLGSLLRDFYHYYAQQGYIAPKGGFRWTVDVVSLRSPGGLLTKEGKGWTGARTDTIETTNVRQRYLLAIEDPFEIEHNVARTVVHNGIVAIRDEFRRAHRLISDSGRRTLKGPECFFAEAEIRENLQHRASGPGSSKGQAKTAGKKSSDKTHVESSGEAGSEAAEKGT